MSASAVGPMGYAKMNTASFVSIHALAGSTESHRAVKCFDGTPKILDKMIRTDKQVVV